MGCHTQKQGGPGAVKGRRCKAKSLCKQKQLEQLEQHKNSTGQFVNGSSASYHSLVALSICQHFFNTSTHTHIPHIFTSCTCHSHVIHVSFQHEAVAKPHHNQPILHCAGGANGLFHICTEEIRLSTSVTKCNESMIFYQGN